MKQSNPLHRTPLLAIVCMIAGLFIAAKTTLADAHVELDILVIYTPAVVPLYMDEAGVIAHASASVESVNIAMENSAIPIVFNLVGVEAVDYVESTSNMADDLYYITGQNDDFKDEDLLAQVRALRDAYGADLVTLFRDGPVAGTAGIAWMPDPNDPQHRYGYSVVSAQSALSTLVLAHELGHNLSSGHGHGVGEGGVAPVLPYARGHRFFANGTNYRTIMAVDQSYQRIANFSNPLVLHEGEPTGVPIGESYEADNASAFGLSGPKIAQFRLTQTENPVFLLHPIGATIVSGQQARLDAIIQGFPPLDIQWYAGMVGDMSTPIGSINTAQEQGGTESYIETPVLSEPGYYWIALSNPNASTQSDAIQVVVIPPLTGPQDVLVVQDKFDTGVSSFSTTLYQDVMLANNFIESIQVTLAKTGNPPPATLRFSALGSEILAEKSIDAAALADWGNGTAVTLDINRFTTPGQTYQISLIPSGGDSNNLFFWAAGNDTQDYEAGIGDNNILGAGVAFKFTVHGQKAWTYHTWLAAEEIPANTGRTTDAAAGDGLPNLARYALGFGADEARSIVAPLLGEFTHIAGEDVIPFAFSVRRDAVDVALSVETSIDLVAWSELDAERIHFIETLEGMRDVYEARVPVNGESRQFIRVRVDNPPN